MLKVVPHTAEILNGMEIIGSTYRYKNYKILLTVNYVAKYK